MAHLAQLQTNKVLCLMKDLAKILAMVCLLWLAISMPAQDPHLALAWKISGLFLTPGCAPGEPNGRTTRKTAQGSNIVDYFLTSLSAPEARTVHAMAVHDKCAESDHCPLTLDMMLQAAAPKAS